LWIYFSNIGDAPERMLRCHLELTNDWKTWKTSSPEDVLRPETEWEGADWKGAKPKFRELRWLEDQER